jgi:universal stress protein A
MLPKNILVPTDFGDGSSEAVAYAAELAAKLGATLHLIHAIPIPTMGVPELGVAITASVMDELVQENQQRLDALADAQRIRTAVGEVMLKTGDARDAINAAAKEIGADLIVMGTHGRKGIVRALLGSVAETVVRSAPCPVLTVHPHEPKHTKRDAA